MHVFEIVIALLLGGAGLAALARRIGTPYPALVALAGAGLALVPGTPTLVLDPELALALFVAPVLLDAAFDASPRDLRANWRSVAGLALGAVALTVVAVALVVRALVPDMPWAAAIALGAIVAPPDAAAATAVLKQLRPPHRLLVILEGESLFNDASALLIYRLAVGATVAGVVVGWNVVPMLLAVTAGSVVLGLVLSPITLSINSRIQDVATAVIVQFCCTFARVDARRAAAPVRNPDDGRLRDGHQPARVGRDAGADPRPVLRGVGSRGLRPERARLHPGRLPAQVDHRAARPGGVARIRLGGGGGVRGDDPRADRLGVGRCGVQPVAVPPDPGRTRVAGRCGRALAARRGAGRLVRHARHRHARRGAGAAGRQRGRTRRSPIATSFSSPRSRSSSARSWCRG